jgi:hypothetical protein
VPFGRYQSGGKGNIRALLIGMALTALMFAILFVAGILVI